MGSDVPAAIMASCSHCEHEFSCLETGRCGERPMCKVADADGKNVLFLKDKGHASCSYRVSFGGGQICACPVHYAIFHLHGR